MKNNLTKRKLQSLESRKKILETARIMIKRHGFDNITIQDICSEAKVSKGLFYNYFSSKDQIILAQIQEMDKYYKIIAEKELKNYSGISKLLKLIELLFRHIKYGVGKDITRNLYRSLIMTNKTGQMIINEHRFFFTLLTDSIKEAQDMKELPRVLDTQKIVTQVATLTWGVLYTWCIYQRDFDVEKMAIEIISTFLDGLNAKAAL